MIEEGTLRWRVRGYDEQPEKAGVLIAVGIAAAAIGVAVFRSGLLGALGFAMILASTAEYWLGSRFEVDGNGAKATVGLSTTAMTWDAVRRVIVSPADVKLSPLAEATRLDAFRGVTLKFSRDNREEVLAAIRAHIGEDVGFLEG